MGGEGVEVAVSVCLFTGNEVFVSLERFDSNTADLHNVLSDLFLNISLSICLRRIIPSRDIFTPLGYLITLIKPSEPIADFIILRFILLISCLLS